MTIMWLLNIYLFINNFVNNALFLPSGPKDSDKTNIVASSYAVTRRINIYIIIKLYFIILYNKNRLL